MCGAIVRPSCVRLFYPEMKGNGWEDFHQLVKSQYGENDPFYKVTELTLRGQVPKKARALLVYLAMQDGAPVRPPAVSTVCQPAEPSLRRAQGPAGARPRRYRRRIRLPPRAR